MSKTKFSPYYTDSKRRYRNGEYTVKTLEGDRLYSYGIYPTTKTEQDLPDYYINLPRYCTRWLDTKHVKDLVYKPNYFETDHLFKSDFLYISWRKPITARETTESWRSAWYENYDICLWGWDMKLFIDEAAKNAKGDILTKIQEISDAMREKMMWYAHVNCLHPFLPNHMMSYTPEITCLTRDLDNFGVNREEQVNWYRDFCEKYNYQIREVIDLPLDAKQTFDTASIREAPRDDKRIPIYLCNDAFAVESNPAQYEQMRWLWNVFRNKNTTLHIISTPIPKSKGSKADDDKKRFHQNHENM